MKEEKPYYLELEDRGEYLYAVVGGDVQSPETVKIYWTEIAEKCTALGISKVLLEKDFAQTITAPEILGLADYLSKILAEKKIALFDRYPNQSLNELGKVIARTHGVQLRVFENLEDAEKWIKRI